MKRFLLLSIIAILVGGCETTKTNIQAPSTASVEAKITRASGSVSEAEASSRKSSEHIKSFKTSAERIEYKATRALEFL